MTDETELARLVLNEETGRLTLKMNNLPDVNVPHGCTLSIHPNLANGRVFQIVVDSPELSDALAESSKHVITVPTRTL